MKTWRYVTVFTVLISAGFPAFLADAAGIVTNNVQERIQSDPPAGVRLPARASGNRVSDPVEVLFHVLYTDYDEEYQNTISAINQYYTNWNYTESVTTDHTVLQAELAGKHLFILPEPELADNAQLEVLGTEFSPTLHDFVQNGGMVVVLCEWAGGEGFLTATGLMTATFSGQFSTGSADVLEPGHFLCAGLGATIAPADATATYTTNGTMLIQAPDGNAVLAVRDIGDGHVVLFGPDFYEYNDDIARVIANAVQWGETVMPTPTPDCFNHGDVNMDGLITAGDAQLAFLIVLGSYSPTYEEECAADCTGDGIVTAGDAQAIFMTALGMGTCADPLP